MLGEILIISCYDCACNFSVKVLEYDGTLNDLKLSMADKCFYDLVCIIDDYIDHDSKIEDYYLHDESYKDAIKEFNLLLKDYDTIILCEDGDIRTVKLGVSFKEPSSGQYTKKDYKIGE